MTQQSGPASVPPSAPSTKAAPSSGATTTIQLFVDYKGEFHVRHTRTPVTTDLDRLAELLEREGFSLWVRSFGDADFRRESFDGVPVLYQSSQDPGLYYKSYIEDVLLGLQLRNAWLIPGFKHFRAHHNKVFMEILRDVIDSPDLHTLRARTFGTYEEFDAVADELEYPQVLKLAGGDSSTGVRLLHDAAQGRQIVRRLSKTFDWKDWYENLERRLRRTGIRPASLNRGKFIVQTFIPNLAGDFKVLVMGDRYYVCQRPTKTKDDFRASGISGPPVFPATLPTGLLDTAFRVIEALDVPFASLDLLPDPDGRFHIGEMQFVRFGTSLVRKGPFHWQRHAGEWRKVEGLVDWETALADAIVGFVRTRRARGRP